MRIIQSPDFTSLPGEAANLFAASGERSIFDHPAWYDVVARQGLPAGTPLSLVMDDEGQAGLVLTGDRGRLALCTTPYTCASSPLFVSAEAVKPLMAELGLGSATLLLTGLDPDAAQFSAIQAGMKSAGLTLHCFRGWINWHEKVEDCDFAQYIA